MRSPDLKVTIHGYSTVQPAEPTKERSMFLSNIDQVLDFNMEAVQFFDANPKYPIDTVVERLLSALRRLLVTYDFVAGRLSFNEEKGRFGIECNGEGVGVVVASSELRLEEVGELCPKLEFRQLAPVDLDDKPLLAFQMTTFKCGGYSLGMSINHIAMDAFSGQIFFVNLATLSSDKPLAIPPYTDRRLLVARSPPRVTFPHPELVELKELQEVPSTFTSNDLQYKLFHLNPDQIAYLKDKARPKATTSFNVVVAHLWRCKAVASDSEDKISTLLYAVDIRNRMRPPLPSSYTGNAILSAYARATRRELKTGPFSRVVQLVCDGAERITDEYIRSVIDWGDLHRGFPMGDVSVTSWWRFGFDDMEFEWGKTKCFLPLPYPGRNLIMIFPGVDKGVNIMVGLPSDVMEKFHDLFYGDLVPRHPRL